LEGEEAMPTNRASTKSLQRDTALQVYVATNQIVVPPGGQFDGLTSRFSSFASTIQNRLAGSNGATTALGGTLEAQVERALSQALRQIPAGAGVPSSGAGQTSIVSLVGGTGGGPPAMSPYQASLVRESRLTQVDFVSLLNTIGPLSAYTDPGDVNSLRALVGAEVQALVEEFSYTRLVPRQQRVRVLLGGLLGWGYDISGATSPLGDNAPAGDIQSLIALLNLGGPLIPTLAVEDQLASQQALGTDAALLLSQWFQFWLSTVAVLPGQPTVKLWPLWEPQIQPAKVSNGMGTLAQKPVNGGKLSFIGLGPQGPRLAQQAPLQAAVLSITGSSGPSTQSFAAKMIQADLLLPVIAQDGARVSAALDAIGLTTGEQETDFIWFWSAVDADLLPPFGTQPPPTPPLPNPGSQWSVLKKMTPIPVYMTVADILDWAQNLAGPSSLDQLRQAGALGLNLVCEQADELFWLALAMLDPTATAQQSALSDSEVQLAVVSLAQDLNLLANLAY
jgi:hypothetical protein